MSNEQIIVFNGKTGANGKPVKLVATLHMPVSNPAKKGVLLAVGGPQNRTGSHRQFLLLARFLADNGIPVFRFDYSGMGDSEGDKTEFLDACEDLDNAIQCFFEQADITEFVFWGLCDAVSLGLMYLSVKPDNRLVDFIALNPWVRQSHTEAQAYLKNYYWQRLKDKNFWIKVLSLKFNYGAAIKGFVSAISRALAKAKPDALAGQSHSNNKATAWPLFSENNYVNAMRLGLTKLPKRFHIILSGNDLTADEFEILVKNDESWGQAIAVAKGRELTVEHATHTFSSKQWRRQVEEFSLTVCR
jgi:exosortase A-associated hydrolase 1